MEITLNMNYKFQNETQVNTSIHNVLDIFLSFLTLYELNGTSLNSS